MGWVWSDELADSLRQSPEIAALVPKSWSARPSAFAATSDEDPAATGRRLLGLASPPLTDSPSELTLCTCNGANVVPAPRAPAESGSG